MGRYQDIIDNYLNQDNDGTYIVLNMLNTKYLIRSKEEYIEYTTRYGAAWFVQSADKMESAKEALEAIGKLDLRSTAIVEEEIPQTTFSGRGKIDLVE